MAWACASSSECKVRSLLDRTPFHCSAHSYSHPNSLRLNLDMPVHLMDTPLVCGRKSENTCRHRRMCKLHTDNGPNKESFFFFSHQCYNNTTLNERTLFEELLYVDREIYSRNTQEDFMTWYLIHSIVITKNQTHSRKYSLQLITLKIRQLMVIWFL